MSCGCKGNENNCIKDAIRAINTFYNLQDQYNDLIEKEKSDTYDISFTVRKSMDMYLKSAIKFTSQKADAHDVVFDLYEAFSEKRTLPKRHVIIGELERWLKA